MSQNPLDRVRRALDPHIRTGSSSREEPTPSGPEITDANVNPNVNTNANVNPNVNTGVNVNSGGQSGPDSSEGLVTAGISTPLSSPHTNFSGFSQVLSQPSQTPNILLATRGSEGLVGTGTAVGSLLVPTDGDHVQMTNGIPVAPGLIATHAADTQDRPEQNLSVHSSDTALELQQIREQLQTISNHMKDKTRNRSTRSTSISSTGIRSIRARGRDRENKDNKRRQRHTSSRSSTSKHTSFLSSDSVSLHAKTDRSRLRSFRHKSLRDKCEINQPFLSAQNNMTPSHGCMDAIN